MLHLHKWTEVDNNIQYCSVCRKARSIKCVHKWIVKNRVQQCTICGEAVPFECPHKWTVVKTQEIISNFHGGIIDTIEVMCCELCGERKQFRYGVCAPRGR